MEQVPDADAQGWLSKWPVWVCGGCICSQLHGVGHPILYTVGALMITILNCSTQCVAEHLLSATEPYWTAEREDPLSTLTWGPSSPESRRLADWGVWPRPLPSPDCELEPSREGWEAGGLGVPENL